jgi:hypothetical protein
MSPDTMRRGFVGLKAIVPSGRRFVVWALVTASGAKSGTLAPGEISSQTVKNYSLCLKLFVPRQLLSFTTTRYFLFGENAIRYSDIYNLPVKPGFLANCNQCGHEKSN